MDFIFNNFSLLLVKIWQQIYLASAGVLIAMLIGIPIGIWIRNKIKIKTAMLAIANVLQTVPSLAILALLIPFLGIGVKPALVALAVYAYLPIIRNTVTGLNGINPSVLEAADGLGFAPRQKLWLIELPLALPVIVAGVRTAMAMSVGLATLAAFIGAGGLGDFIYQGLSLNDSRLILLGAIPAALLALLFDCVIAAIERVLAKQSQQRIKINATKLAVGVIGFFLLFSLIVGYFYQTNKDSIRIGSKNFTEQIILGEMMADLLQANTNLRVLRNFNLGGTLFCHNALIHGEIDIYPEYTGTAYSVILRQHGLHEPAAVYDYVQQAYQKRFHVTWLKPFGFNDAQAIMVRQAFARQHRLTSISSLLPIAGGMSIAVPGDFIRRPDGYQGLKQTYGLNFAKVLIMSPGLMYQAIASKKVAAILGFTTDGRVRHYHLVQLTDNKHLFPPYYAAPLVRTEVLKRHPEIAKVLAKLAGKIDQQTMAKLNYAVDIEHKSPALVAETFLRQQGLLARLSH